LELIRVAADCGADAAKFQLFTKEKLIHPDYWDRLKLGPELPREWIPKLQVACFDAGIEFLCTPFDLDAAAYLHAAGVAAFKIASGDLTYTPLLERIASYGKPVILSTGMVNWGELLDALYTLNQCGLQELILLHCVSVYPAEFDEMNLLSIPRLHTAFKVPVGLSDHTVGILASIGARMLGACVIEKHLTLDCWLSGPDHEFALDPDRFKLLRDFLSHIQRAPVFMFGDGIKRPVKAELPERNWARRGPDGLRPAIR